MLITLVKLLSMTKSIKMMNLRDKVEVTVQRRVNLLKKEEANKYGVMVQPMKAGGGIIEPMDKEG